MEVLFSLFELRDDDGLIPLSALSPIAPGVFEIANGLVLFAHQFFRRSLNRVNTLNTPFLQELAAVDGDLNPRIALDEDMVGLASTYQESIELQYWRGPLFDDVLENIPFGITVHQADSNSKVFNGVCRTEFWWYGQGGIRSFEAEELIDRPTDSESADAYGCRFVHSMLDVETNEPTHLDGAIRVYTTEQMVTRLDVDIYRAGRHTAYTKLWRIDGSLSVSRWKSLISQFYRDNVLVGEYFGAPEPEFEPEMVPEQNDPIQNVIRYNMNPADGVQLHVSYHHKENLIPESRSVVETDFIGNADNQVAFIDSTATEIVKRIRRDGESINLPPEIIRIAFGDTVLNLPLIRHTGPNARSMAETTAAIIVRFVKDMCQRDTDRLVSFCIGVEYEDREVRFAAAGHVEALVSWFDGDPLAFPDNTEQIHPWLEQRYLNLRQLFPANVSNQLLHQLLQGSGMLVFVRKFLPPELFEIHQNERTGDLEIELLIDGSDLELVTVLRSGDVQVAPIYRVDHAVCTVCGEDYENCPHVKFEEERVGQRMVESPLIGAFLTNRKA